MELKKASAFSEFTVYIVAFIRKRLTVWYALQGGHRLTVRKHYFLNTISEFITS